jgi:broad specificity phosphatase PhoE
MRTVLLVRHAEIDELPPGQVNENLPLNSDGRKRAEALAHAVGAAHVSVIFSSPYDRTKQTVKPLATQLGLPFPNVPPVPDFRDAVLESAEGSVFLVVGHSNTVPEMIAALGAMPPVPVLGAREFDNLFVVSVAGPDDASLVHLKY